ncbi:hypothetical protein DRN74_02070 [Candidatus Micrarchaeota archaeon]|nr:MAG: hypothetical protein DRN74_02070 [Candidatus Micrarchaeota archaeon]
MRSLNLKRVAAIAAGAAMVGSTLATGLAAVNTQGDVTSFVQNVKANLDDVEIVVGTNGAAISDGIQAAKLAAVLATLNFEEATDVAAVPDTSGVTIGEKSVKVSTSTGGTIVQPSEVEFPIVYPAVVDYSSSVSYSTGSKPATLTPDVLPGVLTRSTFETITSGGTTVDRMLEEQIVIDSGNVKYAEDTDPDGHGLYWNLGGKDHIHYKLDFTKSGNGLPTGSGNYSETPEITLLGHTYGINTRKLADNVFELYAGDKITLTSGDEYETADGYTIKVNLVSQITSESTTRGKVSLTVTSPDGDEQTRSIQEGNSYEFFGGAVTITVDSAATGFTQENVQTGVATLRIGTGSLKFEKGDPFPLDPAWKVKDITWSSGYLQSIDITYGNPDGETYFEKGDFQGDVKHGLAQGVIVPGPKDADGKSLFNIQLAGFGGSTQIDTTTLEFEGDGSDSDAVMHVTWVDPDGLTNVLDASKDELAPFHKLVAGSNETLNATTEANYFIVNDKLFVFKGWTTEGLPTHFVKPRFAIGSATGPVIEGDPVDMSKASPTGHFKYTSGASATGGNIDCTFTYYSNASKDDGWIHIAYDAATCDIIPDQVNAGMEAVMDQAAQSGTPVTMDLRYVRGAKLNASSETNVDGKTFPVVLLWEANQTYPGADRPIVIMYDGSTTTGFSKDYTGILAGIPTNITLLGNGAKGGAVLNMSEYTDNKLVDTPANSASTSSTIQNKYHITAYSSELSADGNKLTIVVPEAARSAVVKVAKTIEETEGEEGQAYYTLSEGDSISGVTIEEINAEITGLDSITCGAAEGTLYSKKTALDPTALVTTDTAATATYQIVVGGPFVNKLAQAIDTTGLTTTGAGAQYLIATDDGTKLLAAGYTASDTAAAVDELIRLLQG